MNNFTISQLAQFSGVKAHTIRMWEQRHHALQPHRTEGNTRFYDNQQLRRLLNMVSLQECGRKISELSSMSDQELFDLVKQEKPSTASNSADMSFHISQLLAAGMSYDSLHFEKVLAHCLLRYGMKKTYTAVVYPMLTRIGLLWATNELPPAQEHFISNLLRQKLYTAIDSLPPASVNAPNWLLFLPENEFHEIGLLMTDYLLRLEGGRSLYLGPNVPLASVASAVEDWRPEQLLFFMVHRDSPENIEPYLQNLQQLFPDTGLVMACDPELVQQVNSPASIRLLHSIPELEQLMDKIYNTQEDV